MVCGARRWAVDHPGRFYGSVSVDATGTPIGAMPISKDSAGFGQLLTTIAGVVPGGGVGVSLGGSRSDGVGLAGTLAAAGLLVIECEQPSRKQRRGRGKSDPID